MVLFGYPDPADGEGTSPEEIVKSIAQRINGLEQLLPPAYYSDRALNERIQLMVNHWQKSVKACEELEQRVEELERELKQSNNVADKFENIIVTFAKTQDSLKSALRECAESLEQAQQSWITMAKQRLSNKGLIQIHTPYDKALSNPTTQSVLKEK